MKKYFKLILLVGISLIFLTGCAIDLVVPENDVVNSSSTEGSSVDENPAGGLGTGKGTLKIYLTDAPGDYEEVNINISRIEGHIAGDGEEGEDKGSWQLLKEWSGGMPVDLIKLEDVSILLASLELEPNKYTQLRIFLNGEASVVVEGEGEPKTLEIPSSANTGIKLNRPFEIVEGMITKLTIDFDAEKSVIKTGNGKYKMKQVISLSSETYSTGEVPEGTGSVSGSVSYYDSINLLALVGIGGANIELTGGPYIFANTTTTSEELGFEGTFSLDNVPAGTYTLNVYTDDYDDYSESVVIANGGNTVVDVVFLVEEPGGISGRIIDSDSTLAISGAAVSVALSGSSTYNFNSSTSTDEDGIFIIESLPVGVYDITVSAEGYNDYPPVPPVQISVTVGFTNNLGEIGLTPLPPSP